MEKKTSSVEWLVEQLEEINIDYRLSLITCEEREERKEKVIQQAQEMHREEIEKAYEQGNEDGFYSTESKSDYEIEGRHTYLSNQYYNETYGSTKQD